MRVERIAHSYSARPPFKWSLPCIWPLAVGECSSCVGQSDGRFITSICCVLPSAFRESRKQTESAPFVQLLIYYSQTTPHGSAWPGWLMRYAQIAPGRFICYPHFAFHLTAQLAVFSTPMAIWLVPWTRNKYVESAVDRRPKTSDFIGRCPPSNRW